MKLFISQPMRGKSDEEILAERRKAVGRFMELFGDDVEIIDSFMRGAPHDAKPLWFLGESIKLLGEADAAYFCPGWEDARGCRIEHEAAVNYGIITITVKKNGDMEVSDNQ